MITFNEFQSIGENEEDRINFIYTAIADHESSNAYKAGKAAGMFYRHYNPDIEKVKKIFYDFNGIAHTDEYAPNHKISSNLYHILTVQTVMHLLGNGISFSNPKVKEKLGNNFDYVLQEIFTYAVNDGVAYGYVKENEIIPFNFACDEKEPHFIALLDEYTSDLRAGIRYWRLTPESPLCVTLYEESGYTDYEEASYYDKDGKVSKRLAKKAEKKPYREIETSNAIQGVYRKQAENYPKIPIVQMKYINSQSQLVGNRATLTAYDLILSGMVNNADSQLVYWVLKNAEAMDRIDDANFLTNLVQTKILHLPDGVEADPHQIVPEYSANEATLTRLRSQIINDFMAADWERVAAGNVTTVEIKAAYTQLNLKCDEIEKYISEFIRGVLMLYGFSEEDMEFHFQRSTTINETETIQNILAAAPYLGEEMTTKKICEVMGMIDEYENIQDQKARESLGRMDFSGNQNESLEANPQPTESNPESTPDVQEAVQEAEEVKGKALNGAQMQSLLVVMSQLSEGKITEGQAVNIISTAIGITKEQAREIIRGD